MTIAENDDATYAGREPVSAPGVARPVRVEYAWSAYPPAPCLYRKGDGLPLFPFRLESTATPPKLRPD